MDFFNFFQIWSVQFGKTLHYGLRYLPTMTQTARHPDLEKRKGVLQSYACCIPQERLISLWFCSCPGNTAEMLIMRTSRGAGNIIATAVPSARVELAVLLACSFVDVVALEKPV